MTAIECEGLTKFYGETRGVEDLSFAVRDGEVFGFLGPNGAGKTTTIRTLLGFLHPTAGDAEVLGVPVRDRAALREARARVGYLPSDPSFDPDVTGTAFLDHMADLKGDAFRDDLVERFDVPVDRRIGALSRGNRQKLAVVQAFMHDPALAVLDEPTTGLDPLLQEEFHAFVREVSDAGTTVFFSSHVLSEVRKVCDRVGVIRRGHLAALEPIEELLSRGGKRVSVRIAEDVDADDFDLEGVSDLHVGDEVRFTFTGDYDELVSHLAWFTVLDLEVGEAPLEDVFMQFYGERPDADDGAAAGGDSETVAADDSETAAGDDDSETAAGDDSETVAGDDSETVGGDDDTNGDSDDDPDGDGTHGGSR